MLREGAVGALRGDQRDLVDRLDTRGRELLDLVEATLQVNRIEAGRDQVNAAPISLAELVRALDVSTAGLPRPPAVSFEWRLPEAPGTMLRTDRAKLALVIRNLVGNAFKFTSAGRSRSAARGRRPRDRVEDWASAPGRPARSSSTCSARLPRKTQAQRRRLGLHIVKQFVTRLGGRVEVASTPGRGSTFRVAFPGAVVTAGERVAA
jgi:signal transduction histidine kinase